MKEYDNIQIQETYQNLQESMEQLVRSSNDAFYIIWFDIHDWLEPDMKSDLCGILTKKVIGKNLAWEVHGPASNMSCYQEIQRKYAFGKSVNELGEYWKELIREEKPFDLWVLLGCLDVYYKTIMPYVKNEMVVWDNEVCRDNPELLPTLKSYREHRARIKATMQIIETASDILTLRNKAERD